MPSKTDRQRRFMAANCYGSGRGKIPKKVACEYAKRDRTKTTKKRR